MPATSVTEFLFEAKPRWSGTIGAGGVAAAGTTTIPLSSAANLDNGDAYIFVINRVDTAGVKNELSEMETVIGELSGTNFVNCVRGQEGTAQAWEAGTVVEILFTASHWNKLIEWAESEHNADGTHGDVTATSVTSGTIEATTSADLKTLAIDGGTAMTAVKDEDDMTSDSATALATQQSIKAYVDTQDTLYTNTNIGMARQAIINGNFDVWQRGTSLTVGATTTGFIADRWRIQQGADGGTLPTLVHTRQALTAGDIPNSFYHYRVAPNGAGTSLGVNSYGVNSQIIEHGTRLLCGLNKTVTVSFYARASVAGKKMGISLNQNYGSGGSPSAVEYIAGTTISLTSSWAKYTATFTTNTLVGKTFGTDNNDSLELVLWHMWGSTLGTARGLTGTETYGGSGTIDFTQVQLCAGSVALPFQPKSYEEELRACQRYFQLGGSGSVGRYYATTAYEAVLALPVTMSFTPSLSLTTTSPVIRRSGIGNNTGSGSSIASTFNMTTTGVGFQIDGLSGNVGDIGMMAGNYLKISAEL